jgi:hypothetical protein
MSLVFMVCLSVFCPHREYSANALNAPRANKCHQASCIVLNIKYGALFSQHAHIEVELYQKIQMTRALG